MKKIKLDKTLLHAIMWGFALAIPILGFVRIVTLISWGLLYMLFAVMLVIFLHGAFNAYGTNCIVELVDKLVLDANNVDDDDDEDDSPSSIQEDPYW